ncbi:type II secretion system minor pseudopilin GspI [Viridibacterium curvum]|uniref:Type II secretion system protein I n=1 Tax=Viridibacterium curvum TaxID=1101404 RepID=A0ABP9QCZ2_9RHOO
MPRRDHGFTLLEVLIALAVLAIALTAVSRGIGLVAIQATELGERHAAQWLAQNRMALLRIVDVFPDPSVTNEGDAEQAGYKLHYRETIKATDNPLFRRVEIKVSREDGTQLAKLTGFAARAAP